MRLLLAAILALFTAAGAAATAPAPATAKKQPLAGSVVRSDEYIVHRGKQETEEFIGHVDYRRAERRLRSDWALYNRITQVWNARGHVWLREQMKNGDILEGWGHEGTHDMKTGKGSLSPERGGEARFVHSDKTGERDKGRAGFVEWDQAANTCHAQKSVHGWGPDGEFWSEDAFWRNDSHIITLKGRRPVLLSYDPKHIGALQGDVIVGYQDQKRLEADGTVRGWIRVDRKDKRGK